MTQEQLRFETLKALHELIELEKENGRKDNDEHPPVVGHSPPAGGQRSTH
jgi:hypothetical protein